MLFSVAVSCLLLTPALAIHTKLPTESRYTTLDSDKQLNVIKQIVEDAVSPIRQDLSSIRDVLNLDTPENDKPSEKHIPKSQASEKSLPRFRQKMQSDDSINIEHHAESAQVSEGVRDALSHLGLTESNLKDISGIVGMFADTARIAKELPPGLTATPNKITDLIQSSLNASPNLDKAKLNKLLDNWRLQLKTIPGFSHLSPPTNPPTPPPPQQPPMPYMYPNQQTYPPPMMYPIPMQGQVSLTPPGSYMMPPPMMQPYPYMMTQQPQNNMVNDKK